MGLISLNSSYWIYPTQNEYPTARRCVLFFCPTKYSTQRSGGSIDQFTVALPLPELHSGPRCPAGWLWRRAAPPHRLTRLQMVLKSQGRAPSQRGHSPHKLREPQNYIIQPWPSLSQRWRTRRRWFDGEEVRCWCYRFVAVEWLSPTASSLSRSLLSQSSYFVCTF